MKKIKVINLLAVIVPGISFVFGIYFFSNFQHIVQSSNYKFGSYVIFLSSIVFFMVLLIESFFLIAKYKNKIRVAIYEKPQGIIEKSYGNKGISYLFYFIFSLLTTLMITMLIYILPSNSFVSILPFEDVSESLEQGIQIVTNTTKTMLTPNSISVTYGSDFNRNAVILYSMLFTGPALLYLLKELKKRQDEEPVKKSDNESVNEPDEEKFPGSKSLLIFLYVSILIVIPRILSLSQNNQLGLTFGWMPPFITLSAFTTLIMLVTNLFLNRNRK